MVRVRVSERVLTNAREDTREGSEECVSVLGLA